MRSPSLACFSDGGTFPPLELLELCVNKRIPFVTIEQANNEFTWYSDELAERYRRALSHALRCFFVSETNRALAEKQIGGELKNSEVVRNPFGVRYEHPLPWPPLGENGLIRFATVGRLWPPSKGQDLLLEALAGPAWRDRQWRLSIYGEGPVLQGLQQLARKLGLTERVVFAGFSSVEKIWAANHVLIMPSRYEGLPIAMVEAMLCARPVIATNVAGHAEIVEDGVTGFLADAPTAASIGFALERFWAMRQEAEHLGKAARAKIRQLVPEEPVHLFSDKLKRLAAYSVGSAAAKKERY
jgi:glycosyltransferase involved in cell wall biosynthesis